MHPDRWAEVERIFHAAAARPAGERAAFVRDACRDDDKLRRDVESLLARPASARGFLDGPAVAVAAQMVSDVGASVLSGRRLGAYLVHERIGAGGMGEVYRARDSKLGRDVALKILPHVFTGDPDRLARFEREARVLASLNHPHIGAIYGLEDADGIRALVLELVSGETLADRIACGPIPVNDALPIARQLVDALDTAHEKGIVHRDLKPANIKITPDGVVKVLDFGLAKAASADTATADLTRSPTATVGGTREGVILGTAAYMSPEQARGHAIDKRTDIWAFGCVLYEMLTGRAVFARNTMTDTLAAVVEREPDWTLLPGTALAPVRKLLERCLEKEPKWRLRDIGDVRHQLDEVEAGLQLQSIATAGSDSDASSKQTALRFVPWGIAAAAILVAVVTLLRGASPPAVNEATPFSFTVPPPTDKDPFPIAPMFLTVAPDGSGLAVVAGEVSGNQRLYLRTINSVEMRALQGTENVDQPFWSADSRSIAFVDRLQSKLKRIDVAGGPPRTIADVPGGQTLQGGTWNQNGDILFGIIGGGNPLFKVPAGGGTPVPATTLDRAAGELGHFWPHFLPDGDHFLYTVPNARADRSGIYLGSLKSSGSTRVVDSLSNAVYSEPGFLLFVRDETLLAQRFDLARMTLIEEPVVVANGMGTGAGNGRAAFAASRDGVLAYRPQSGGVYTTTLMWLDRSGKSLGPVGSPNLHRSIAVSPDGTRVAVQIGWTVGSDIWVTDFIRGIPTRLTSDPSNEEWPVWSPDGTRIAFASNRDGSVFNIFDMPADGSAAPHLLFQSDRSKKPVQWSNDGHWLLFDSNGIYALPLDGIRTPIAIGSGTRQASFAKISPDGAWVAYSSDETGRSEIFLQRFPSPSGRWPVSNNGGTRPHWRGDGRELYYLGFDNQFYAVPVTPGSPPVIGAAKALFPVRLTSAPTGATMFDGIEPSSDGQRFLINLAGESASPQAVTVKVNWPLTLKR